MDSQKDDSAEDLSNFGQATNTAEMASQNGASTARRAKSNSDAGCLQM